MAPEKRPVKPHLTMRLGGRENRLFTLLNPPSGCCCLCRPPSAGEESLRLGQAGSLLVSRSCAFVDPRLVLRGGLWAVCVFTEQAFAPRMSIGVTLFFFLPPQRPCKICSVENSPTHTLSSGPTDHFPSQLVSRLEDNHRHRAGESRAQKWVGGLPVLPWVSPGRPGVSVV